jgi:hypothetical protein
MGSLRRVANRSPRRQLTTDRLRSETRAGHETAGHTTVTALREVPCRIVSGERGQKENGDLRSVTAKLLKMVGRGGT